MEVACKHLVPREQDLAIPELFGGWRKEAAQREREMLKVRPHNMKAVAPRAAEDLGTVSWRMAKEYLLDYLFTKDEIHCSGFSMKQPPAQISTDHRAMIARLPWPALGRGPRRRLGGAASWTSHRRRSGGRQQPCSSKRRRISTTRPRSSIVGRRLRGAMRGADRPRPAGWEEDAGEAASLHLRVSLTAELWIVACWPPPKRNSSRARGARGARRRARRDAVFMRGRRKYGPHALLDRPVPGEWLERAVGRFGRRPNHCGMRRLGSSAP